MWFLWSSQAGCWPPFGTEVSESHHVPLGRPSKGSRAKRMVVCAYHFERSTVWKTQLCWRCKTNFDKKNMFFLAPISGKSMFGQKAIPQVWCKTLAKLIFWRRLIIDQFLWIPNMGSHHEKIIPPPQSRLQEATTCAWGERLAVLMLASSMLESAGCTQSTWMKLYKWL